jgi:hypothetical protein
MLWSRYDSFWPFGLVSAWHEAGDTLGAQPGPGPISCMTEQHGHALYIMCLDFAILVFPGAGNDSGGLLGMPPGLCPCIFELLGHDV